MFDVGGGFPTHSGHLDIASDITPAGVEYRSVE